MLSEYEKNILTQIDEHELIELTRSLIKIASIDINGQSDTLKLILSLDRKREIRKRLLFNLS